MKIFDAQYLDNLTSQAKAGPRLWQHPSIPEGYQDVCQRLFNAIKPGGYIHSHRLATEPREELLISIHGSMALMRLRII